MKQLLFLLALVLPLGLCAAAEKDNPTLVGVWQQVQQSKGDGHLIQLPVWKVMQSDGQFCTFLIANQGGQSIMTSQGSYTVTSDNTCVEHITGSITDPELVGKDNTITYRFVSPDVIDVTYRIPGATRDGHETWRRVKLELPQ